MDFSIETDIAAPTATVWAVMSDVEKWHEWTASIARVERLDGGPFTVGSRARVFQPKLPPAVWQVTRLDPGRGFTWVSRAPGALVTGDHDVAPSGTGSRARLAIRYEGPVGRIVGWIFAGITRRYVTMESEGLKRRTEAS